MELVAVAEIAGMGFGPDQLDQRRAAKPLRQPPCLGLVDEHERRVQYEALFHAEVERHLQRLDRVIAAVGIAGIIRLADAGDDVFEAAAIGEGCGEGEEDEVAAGHEGVGQALVGHGDGDRSRQGGVGDLAEGRETECMVRPQSRRPFGFHRGQPVADRRAAGELDLMTLAIVEAKGLDMAVAVEGPGQAGGRILPAGEEDKGAVVSHGSRFVGGRHQWAREMQKSTAWTRASFMALSGNRARASLAMSP